MTALEHAVEQTMVKCVRVLLSRGARIDVGQNPLLLVCGERWLHLHKKYPDYEQISDGTERLCASVFLAITQIGEY